MTDRRSQGAPERILRDVDAWIVERETALATAL